MARSSSSYLLVAAFDFGTTYSGYAFSFRDNPLKVETNQNWVAGSEKLISLKTPTCLLVDPGRNFHSFGFQAENKYADLAEEGKHHGWLLFRQFKMMLHNNKEISRDIELDDITGTKMRAMTIFGMSIRYLRNHLLEALNLKTTGIEESDIFYIITVPAIWDNSAKQFMREAAIEAGIDSSRLKLALEPEVASLWCQTITDGAKASLSGTGTTYMVVDLGGGTADITVHEKLNDGTLKELHKASGGPWGGTYVDNNYLQWMEKLFGKLAMDRFKKEEMADYFYMLRGFESIKRTISVESNDPITFRIPVSLKDKTDKYGEHTLEEQLKELNLSERVTITRDKMRIHPEIVRSWFVEPVNNIVSHVKEILENPMIKCVNSILLVGGFSESLFVQKRAITDKVLIVPSDAGLAVLKGAVKFGHEPSAVSARVMQYTYGTQISVRYDENKHNGFKITEHEDGRFVDDMFKTFVRVGETINYGETISVSFVPQHAYLESSLSDVFCSTEPYPTFTTDPSCRKLGVLVIQLPDGEKREDKAYELMFVFGDTELIVKARVKKTGKEFYTIIDCFK